MFNTVANVYTFFCAVKLYPVNISDLKLSFQPCYSGSYMPLSCTLHINLLEKFILNTLCVMYTLILVYLYIFSLILLLVCHNIASHNKKKLVHNYLESCVELKYSHA